MVRIKKLRNGTKQKWNGLPHHQRLTITTGILIAILLFSLGVYLLNGKSRATDTTPESLLFRAIVEQKDYIGGDVIGGHAKRTHIAGVPLVKSKKKA